MEPQEGFNYAVQLNLKWEYRKRLPQADEPGCGPAPNKKSPADG